MTRWELLKWSAILSKLKLKISPCLYFIPQNQILWMKLYAANYRTTCSSARKGTETVMYKFRRNGLWLTYYHKGRIRIIFPIISSHRHTFICTYVLRDAYPSTHTGICVLLFLPHLHLVSKLFHGNFAVEAYLIYFVKSESVLNENVCTIGNVTIVNEKILRKTCLNA